MKLCSLSELKEYLEIDASVTDYDSALIDVIEKVSKEVETTLNRKLKKQQRVEYFPTGKKIYSLSAYPVDEDSITVEVWGSQKTKDSDYFVWADSGIVEFVESTGTPWPKKVKITYTGGYEEVNGIVQVPDDLKRAVILICAFDFKKKRKSELGIDPATSLYPSSEARLPDSLEMREARRILTRYRRIPYG